MSLVSVVWPRAYEPNEESLLFEQRHELREVQVSPEGGVGWKWPELVMLLVHHSVMPRLEGRPVPRGARVHRECLPPAARENADREQLKRRGWNLSPYFPREACLPQTCENRLKFLGDIPKVAQR